MSVKGLRKMIYPFAPDQSGAVAVLYELGGMIIICDAGGCAGNICGFDEPRWFTSRSSIFSAGLRDMDAILGRDDLMIDKIAKASKKLDSKFIAIIGTPVPATIATDYKALKRMAERRTGLPVVTVPSNGILWYDEGIEKAYLELFRRFASEAEAADIIPGSAGVIGATPLDTDILDAGSRIRGILTGEGASEVIVYGSGSSLEDFALAGRMEKNIVTSPAGIKAARYLRDRFGTPYECRDPLADGAWEEIRQTYTEENGRDIETDLAGRRILVIHQQVRANSIRELIRRRTDADIAVASWFRMDSELREDSDFRIREEADFFALAADGGYDVIIADGSFRRAAKGFGGTFIDLPHFAVSGHLSEDVMPQFYT